MRHGHYVTFQLAEIAIPRTLFAEIFGRIDSFRPARPDRMMPLLPCPLSA